MKKIILSASEEINLYRYVYSTKTSADKEDLDLGTIYPKSIHVNPMGNNPLGRNTQEMQPVIDCDEEDHTVDSPILWFNRIIMCTFAVTFLWSTSLQICSSLASWVIPTPPFSTVVSHCQFAYDQASENKRQYEKCVDYQISTCNANLESAELDEWRRIKSIEASNSALLIHLQSSSANCTSSIDHSKAIMTAWQSGGIGYNVPILPSCPAEQRELVKTMIGDQSISKETTVSLVNSYVETTNTLVARLVDYSIELSSYNSDYVYNKTKSLEIEYLHTTSLATTTSMKRLNDTVQDLNQLIFDIESCLGMDTKKQHCPYGPSLYSVYIAVAYNMNAYLSRIETALRELNLMIDDYVSEVEDAIDKANSFYDSINGARGLIAWLVSSQGLFGSAKQLCGKSSPNWCSFSKADWFVPIKGFTKIQSLDRMPDSSEIWGGMMDTVENMDMKVLQLQGRMRKNINLWREDILTAVHGVNAFPDDYNPPVYSGGNTSQEIKKQQQYSKTFVDVIEKSIYNTTLSVSTATADTSKSVNATVNSFSSAMISKFETAWSSFQQGGLSFSFLWNVFGSVNGLFYLLDYLYRGVQTAKLVAQFWSRSIVRLPKIQLSNSRTFVSSHRMTWLTYVSWFLKVLPFLWFQLCVIIGIFILITWLIAEIMIPEYNSYRAGCVFHSLNHSFVSANLAALSINYAAMDGNSDLATGISAYNIALGAACTKGIGQSTSTYSKTLSSMLSLNATLKNSINQAAVLLSCVDIATLDASVVSSCCKNPSMCTKFEIPKLALSKKCPISFDNVSPLTLYESMLDPLFCSTENLLFSDGSTFTNHFGRLQSSIFQCDVLPECHITCKGPNVDSLHATGKDCACMAEWYGNGYLIQLFISLLIYVVLNLSRILICSGVLSLLWSSLSPRVFQMEGECDDEGNLFDAEASKFIIDKEDIKKRVNDRLYKFQLIGVCKVLCGIMLNSLWIIMLIFLQSNLAYTPQ